MGVDARWICHTCKTMCYADGARSYLNYKIKLAEAKQFLKFIDVTYSKVFSGYHTELIDGLEVRSLRDFVKWAERHKGHKIYLTNDVAVSKDDLPDYRAETVDGVVNKVTFGEELDFEAQYYIENYCPRCSSFIGDHPNREEITGVIKKAEVGG